VRVVETDLGSFFQGQSGTNRGSDLFESVGTRGKHGNGLKAAFDAFGDIANFMVYRRGNGNFASDSPVRIFEHQVYFLPLADGVFPRLGIAQLKGDAFNAFSDKIVLMAADA